MIFNSANFISVIFRCGMPHQCKFIRNTLNKDKSSGIFNPTEVCQMLRHRFCLILSCVSDFFFFFFKEGKVLFCCQAQTIVVEVEQFVRRSDFQDHFQFLLSILQLTLVALTICSCSRFLVIYLHSRVRNAIKSYGFPFNLKSVWQKDYIFCFDLIIQIAQLMSVIPRFLLQQK